jgi:hypothetical protein
MTGVHVTVKRTGTTKENWLSDSFYGGRGRSGRAPPDAAGS